MASAHTRAVKNMEIQRIVDPGRLGPPEHLSKEGALVQQ
jgi:hypothetical protein